MSELIINHGPIHPRENRYINSSVSGLDSDQIWSTEDDRCCLFTCLLKHRCCTVLHTFDRHQPPVGPLDQKSHFLHKENVELEEESLCALEKPFKASKTRLWDVFDILTAWTIDLVMTIVSLILDVYPKELYITKIWNASRVAKHSQIKN